MTNRPKAKGDAAEREIAALLADHLGVTVRRKLGVGRTDDTGDLDGLDGVCAQVKHYKDIARAIREALAGLEAQTVNADATWGVAFVRRPGGRWIAVMDVPGWCGMYREAMA